MPLPDIFSELFGQAPLGASPFSAAEYEQYRAKQQAALPDMEATVGQFRAEREYTGRDIHWRRFYQPANVETRNPEGTLALIKKSIKEIKAEAMDGTAQGRIEDKILRLLECGATAQAMVLEVELSVRRKLNHLKEWDYKVLPAEEIGRFESEHRMTATKDGIKVHINPLETYQGNPESGEAKDRIIPDNVLDSLEQAKERKLFDTFSVLWVEKVKDPLLLGSIDGCKDYFLIAEWGEDVSFDDIVSDQQG